MAILNLIKPVIMGLVVVASLGALSARAEEPKTVLCTAEYYRVNIGGGWGLSGDSNGVLEPKMEWSAERGEFSGTAAYRFKMDQSSDDSPSPYEIRGDFSYSEGNGLNAVFTVYRHTARCASIIGNFVASADGEGSKIQRVGMLGPELNRLRLQDPTKNLVEWVKAGKLKQDDLLSVNINFCSLR